VTAPSNPDTRKVGSLRELPQSIEPAHELWPGIEAQLGDLPLGASAPAGDRPTRRGATRLRWLAAAAMVACVAVGVWIGRSLVPGLPGNGTSLTTQNERGMQTPPALAGPHYVSDSRYEHERAELVRTLQARLAALPPPARAKVSASLASIEKAKADLEQALGRDPSNALLQELLINTYQDEMRVLTDVHEASDPGRGI
jgi:hypothetical protein